MQRSLSSFVRMSWRDRYLLVVIACYLTIVRLSLLKWRFTRRSSFQFLAHPSLELLSLFYPATLQPSLGKLIWLVNVSARLLPGEVKCLAKAITAKAIAQHFHYPIELHLGVAKDKRKTSLEAHAWVSYQGKIVLGALPDLSRFVPLVGLST